MLPRLPPYSRCRWSAHRPARRASPEDLEAYARSHDHAHWPAWVAFNKRVRVSSGDVGIWHETYLVRAGEYEAIYGAMPRVGLAAAGRHVPIAHKGHTAARRVGRRDDDAPAARRDATGEDARVPDHAG